MLFNAEKVCEVGMCSDCFTMKKMMTEEIILPKNVLFWLNCKALITISSDTTGRTLDFRLLIITLVYSPVSEKDYVYWAWAQINEWNWGRVNSLRSACRYGGTRLSFIRPSEKRNGLLSSWDGPEQSWLISTDQSLWIKRTHHAFVLNHLFPLEPEIHHS